MFVNWQRELAVALCESWTIMLSENSTSTLWFLWERISRNKCITWCASIINSMVVYWCQYIPTNSKIKLGCRRRRCSCAFVLSSNYEWSCQKVSSFYINIPSSDPLLKRLPLRMRKHFFLEAGWHLNLMRFESARPDHMRVDSSSCCFA